MTAPRNRGMTLLEIMLGMTILGLVFLVCLGGLQAGSRAWESGERGIEQQQRLRILAERLTRELKSAYPYYHTTEDRKHRLAFVGDSERLDYVTTADAYGLMPYPLGIKKMALYVRSGGPSGDGGLVLKESFVAAEDLLEPDGEGVEHILDPGVVDLRLRYFYYPPPERRGGDEFEVEEGLWSELWNPEEGDPAEDEGEEEDGKKSSSGGTSDDDLTAISQHSLPAAVELTLTLEDQEGRRREFPPLIMALKDSAVAGATRSK